MSDTLSLISKPIEKDMKQFQGLFSELLSHNDGLLHDVLQHIMKRGGKRMRPMLTLLIARALYTQEHGEMYRDFKKLCNVVGSGDKQLIQKALYAACSLELLHTASLVHDDVVDEADERRGQQSVNASYTNRIAILVGDYILSASLKAISECADQRMTNGIARLGLTLSEGEVRQIQNISDKAFSIDAYYDVIGKKTAALFEACCYLGALSVGASEENTAKACHFGHDLGIVFQIRDDIFDYSDSKEVGKPTGKDMKEGKLTLPALFVLNDANCPENITAIALKIKNLSATKEEMDCLVDYTKQHGGINYAQQAMEEYSQRAMTFIEGIQDERLKASLKAYLDYVAGRSF